MIPTWKHERVENQLTDLFGFDRRESIWNKKCVPPPIGCGKQITGFRNKLQEQEYLISGLCGTCQDEIFGANPANWEEWFEDEPCA